MRANTEFSKFTGVAQIVRYNWPFYAGALLLSSGVLLVLALWPSPFPLRIALILVATVSIYLVLSSLTVSHYVYDRSPLYEWNWLTDVLSCIPRSYANIHAGLDQTSAALQHLFPSARSRTLDIYQTSQMSEPSIERARRHAGTLTSSELANPTSLPLDDQECDTIFVIFAAHELRSHEAKLSLFREIHRSLRNGGSVVLVEHLRDWKNLLAYGPGAFHFFSRREWISVATQAEFGPEVERSVTPFVRCFVFSKSK